MSQLVEYPRFMIAVARIVSTIRSPTDGQDGLATFWTRDAARKVACRTPGAVVVEATQEPWLYIGTENGGRISFQRISFVVVLRQFARDRQH